MFPMGYSLFPIGYSLLALSLLSLSCFCCKYTLSTMCTSKRVAPIAWDCVWDLRHQRNSTLLTQCESDECLQTMKYSTVFPARVESNNLHRRCREELLQS